MRQTTKLIEGDFPTGAMTPRTQRMPPPGYHMSTLPADLNGGESGPQSPVNLGKLPDEISPKATHKRKHKKISPDEVRSLSTRNADVGRQALLEAEALWQMPQAPVYADTFLLEEFDDLSIRLAQRGFRWVKMAQAAGISVANRRYRAEPGARQGYGVCRPNHMALLFSAHDEFGRSKARYMATLTVMIEEHQSGSPRPYGDRPRRRSSEFNRSV